MALVFAIFATALTVGATTTWYLKYRVKSTIQEYVHDLVKHFELPEKVSYHNYEYSNQKLFLYQLCSNVTYTNYNDEELPVPTNFELTQTISTMTPKGLSENLAMIFYHRETKITYIIFSGSATKHMWLKDVSCQLVNVDLVIDFENPVMVHKGFQELYGCTRNIIMNTVEDWLHDITDKYVIAGHSLGGALATLCAYDLNTFLHKPINVCTFGSPRVGNVPFAEVYGKLTNITTHRIFNTEDVVPNLPLPAPMLHYTHVGDLVPFTKNLENVVENHTTAYEEFLENS